MRLCNVLYEKKTLQQILAVHYNTYMFLMTYSKLYYSGIVCLCLVISVLFCSCYEDPYPKCSDKCSEDLKACRTLNIENRDKCKAVCREQYPEYIDCYWHCRMDSNIVDICLSYCVDDTPNGELGEECVLQCDSAYKKADNKCNSEETKCDYYCYYY